MNSGRPRYDHELLGSSFAHNAELAAVPPPQGPLNIVTPCHGMPLVIVDDGEYIYCARNDCHNSWFRDGTVDHWQEAE